MFNLPEFTHAIHSIKLFFLYRQLCVSFKIIQNMGLHHNKCTKSQITLQGKDFSPLPSLYSLQAIQSQPVQQCANLKRFTKHKRQGCRGVNSYHAGVQQSRTSLPLREEWIGSKKWKLKQKKTTKQIISVFKIRHLMLPCASFQPELMQDITTQLYHMRKYNNEKFCSELLLMAFFKDQNF